MSIILGIDPALTKLGWGVVKHEKGKIQYVASGSIVTSASEQMHKRLFFITSEINKIIQTFAPTAIAMEESFINKNAVSSMKLSYVRGAIMSLVGGYSTKFFEYKPNLIKKTIVGVGHAEKSQIIYMINLIISGAPNLTSRSDEADALAVAYTSMVLGESLLCSLD